jgi:transposase
MRWRSATTCNLTRIWVAKYEHGAFEDDVRAADLLHEYETKIAALERLVGGKRLRSNS